MHEFDTRRLETFVDAVLAILITILVLDFKVPHVEEPTSRALAEAIRQMLPSIFSFCVSFLTIAVLWLDHHHLIHCTGCGNYTFARLNLLFVFCLTPLPFTTAFAGEYHTTPFAVALLGANYLIMNLAFNLLFAYVQRAGLFQSEVVSPSQAQTNRRTAMIGMLVIAAGIPLAYLNTYVSFGCYIVVVFVHLFKRSL